MALVSYDYGSGSENEDEDEPSPSSSAVIINNSNKTEENKLTEEKQPTQQNGSDDQIRINEDGLENSDMPEILSHLPKIQENKDINIVEDKIEDFIPKYQPVAKEKKPQKVKITIPALSEFDDDDEEEEPERKKVKKSVTGSTLLSMLPPVRGSPLTTKSFVPNVLKNKPPRKSSDKSKSNMLIPQAVKKKAEEAKKATIAKISKISGHASDAESDDDVEVPETFDDEMWKKVCGRKTKPKPQIIEPEENIVIPTVNIAPEPVKPYDGLDNAAFKELVGKSKRPVNVKLIDINEEEIISDKDLWLTKSLTDPDSGPKPVVENPVDPTRKKKHHITYLAEQAKANEQELQSQWSSNKFARNQTRAKYGF